VALESQRNVERSGAPERLLTGSAEPKEFLRHSFGYSLPRRGSTRSDASQSKYSRLTDGDPASYWKSNPYLTKRFTGEEDSRNPQWIVIDFGTAQEIDAIRIAWANPFARKYAVQYWVGEDAFESGRREFGRFSPAAKCRTERRNGGAEIVGRARENPLRADLDDGIVEHLRHARKR